MKDPKFWIRILAVIIVLALIVPLALNAFATSYPYDTICVEEVNMRKAARISAKLVDRIAAGDPVSILGASGDYYQVKYNGKTGYAMKQYIDGTSPTPDAELPEGVAPQVLTVITAYPYDTQVIYQVKLRKTAADSGEVIRLLQEGTNVTVQAAATGNYVKVKTGGTVGYVVRTHINYAEIPEDTASTQYTELCLGDTGEAVLCLQSALAELGYLEEEAVDGNFGKTTESAVKMLQKRNGRSQDGIASADLQALIYEGTPKDSRGYRQYVKTVAPVEGALIRSGSKGSAVTKAQDRLAVLGYYTGESTGVCDDETVAAIKLFEGMNGLNADGELSSEDQVQLYSEYALAYSSESTETAESVPEFSATLRKGSKGDAVTAVQNRLAELGYYSGEISGVYNNDTVAAVKAFQSKNSLTADGVVGSVTHTVLYGANAIAADGAELSETSDDESEETAADSETTENATDENGEEIESTSEIEVIRAGCIGAAVLKLQFRLQELGYYTSRLDGMYLSDDISAVRAFQKNNGLTVDGTAGVQTQTLLYAENAVGTDSPISDEDATTILRSGSTGDEVTKLQERLIALGYLSTSADGNYAATTTNAVKAFQKAAGLSVDGIAGIKTQEALYADDAPAATNSTLRLGMVSDAVKDLQTKLIALGYLTGKADGIFGTKTVNALIAFQKANGLTADGIAGKSTLTKLSSSAAVAATDDEEEEEEETTVQDAPAVSTVSASKVQYVYWYSGLRNKCKLLPNVTVYDFTSGISWQVNMFSLGAHADCEPLTATDTAEMNRAFGGVTTWTPKAVWVVFSDGSVYIGSTHNTPHGVQHNTSNNFSGHMCIHFPRTAAQVASIGPYATSHQKAIDLGWEATVKKAAQ